MMGPLLTYDGDLHLELLLNASRNAHIEVQPDFTYRSAFQFRRGWGLVRGFRDWGAPGKICFGFGHPFNPLFWPADGKLLRDLEQLFLAHGCCPVIIQIS